MALSAELGKAGFTPDSIETTAVVTLDLHDKPTVTKSHLTTKAKIPNIDKAKFDEIAAARRPAVRSRDFWRLRRSRSTRPCCNGQAHKSATTDCTGSRRIKPIERNASIRTFPCNPWSICLRS